MWISARATIATLYTVIKESLQEIVTALVTVQVCQRRLIYMT